jgi:RNA polymerase sigma-70 factor, ECF subfamily
MDRLQKIEELVKQYRREMVNFHFRFTGNRQDAEDLAQETFIKAYKKINTLKEQGKERSWLYAIARNTAIDFFRKNKNRAIALEDTILENMAVATTVDFQEGIIGNEAAKELQKYVNKLINEDRAIVKLLYYEGFSYREIAELLKINENTLKSRLHRARKVLLEMIRTSKTLGDLAAERNDN